MEIADVFWAKDVPGRVPAPLLQAIPLPVHAILNLAPSPPRVQQLPDSKPEGALDVHSLQARWFCFSLIQQPLDHWPEK